MKTAKNAAPGSSPTQTGRKSKPTLPAPGPRRQIKKHYKVKADRMKKYYGMKNPSHLTGLYQSAGMDRREAAAYLGIDRSTLRRYESGASRIPVAVWRLLEACSGELGALHPAWRGFSIGIDGGLYASGYRDGLMPGDVLYGHIARQHVALLEVALRRYREPRRPAPPRLFTVVDGPDDADDADAMKIDLA